VGVEKGENDFKENKNPGTIFRSKKGKIHF